MPVSSRFVVSPLPAICLLGDPSRPQEIVAGNDADDVVDLKKAESDSGQRPGLGQPKNAGGPPTSYRAKLLAKDSRDAHIAGRLRHRTQTGARSCPCLLNCC